MTEQEQIKALAELDGPPLFLIHKPIHAPFGYYRPNACGYTSNPAEAWHVTEDVGRKYATGDRYRNEPDRVELVPVPPKPYLTSYDAIIPLVQKQPIEIRVAMFDGYKVSIMTPPAKFCEDLLRATGKWKDQ